MRLNTSHLIAFFSIAVLVQRPAISQSPNELVLRTEKVIAFKDGNALIIKRGVATPNQKGEVYTEEVPDAAILGSFWAVPAEGRLVGMHAGWRESDSSNDMERLCRDTLEILIANKGKQAKIETQDKTIVQGKILEVLTEPVETPIEKSHWPALGLASDRKKPKPTDPESRETKTLRNHQGNHFVLRTEESDLFMNVAAVRSISVENMRTTLAKTVTTSSRTKRLTFQVADLGKKQDLTIMYFRPGFRWIPTYRISLKDKGAKKLADITLQAELLNEAEDFTDVPIDIVVGVPNFRFKGTVSPLTLENQLRNALRDAEPQLMGQMLGNQFSNAMYSQRSGEFRRDAVMNNDAEGGGAISLPNELTASGEQDLFVYRLPPTTIAKGERATKTIFDAECPYQDVYTWDIQVNRQGTDAAPSGAGTNSPLALAKNEVWHQIELTNSTKLPWTTGAAMLVQGNQPLAQELLTYTSPANPCRIPITVALELKGSFEESETNRELQSLQWDGYHYAKITKQANVHLCNNKKNTVDIEIQLRLGGRVTEATQDGTIELHGFRNEDWINYHGSPAVNNSSIVRWKSKLEPGQVLNPIVKCYYYSRH